MSNEKAGSRVCKRYSLTLRHEVKHSLGMLARSAFKPAGGRWWARMQSPFADPKAEAEDRFGYAAA
ncbi:MAG: hypothetical protein LBK66_04355 [Spirochaetaceae bacterium]|nr:hypothetical protein [Spirochaetaceae bacterium]